MPKAKTTTDTDPPASSSASASSSALREDPTPPPAQPTKERTKGRQKAVYSDDDVDDDNTTAQAEGNDAPATADDAPLDDTAAPGADEEDLFNDELLPLHPTVVAFLNETPIHDRVLPDRLRKRLLRAFPPVADFSVRAPQTDQAFASLAHPNTLRRDRQLVNLTILQLQAIRPLLLAWSELLDIQDPSQQDRNLMEALRTSICLSLHAVATATTLRRKWILNDVNPGLVRTLSAPTTPLFGEAVTKRLQEADTVATTVRKLQQRPNGQRGDQRNSNSNYSNNRSNSNSYNNNNRYSGRSNAYGRDNRNYGNNNNNQRQRYNSNNNNSDRFRNSDGRTRDSNSHVPPGNHA
jgi:hypothetical protein